jgi:hypothetical protein
MLLITNLFWQPLASAETRVHVQGNPRGIYGELSDTETGVFTEFIGFSPVRFIPSMCYIHLFIIWGLDNVSVRRPGQQGQSLTPLQQ